MGKEWDRLGQHWRIDRSPDKTGRGSWFGDNHDSPRYGGEPHKQQMWHQAWATEALRVLKPGGHLLAFGGTRTYHRLACAIEDAGFEIRDSLMWLYGSGFPKSLDVGKAIDKRPGVVRHAEFAQELREAIKGAGFTSTFDVAEQVVGRRTGAVANWQKYQWPEAKWWPALRDLLGMDAKWDAVIAEAERKKIGKVIHARSGGLDWAKIPGSQAAPRTEDLTAPATPEAQQWNGWGTALKPAWENVVCAVKPSEESGASQAAIVLARKPLLGTVAQNVLEHGTGALNVDGTRIGHASDADRAESEGKNQHTRYANPGSNRDSYSGQMPPRTDYDGAQGRWPANLVLSHHEDCIPVGVRRVKGITGTAQGKMAGKNAEVYGDFEGSDRAGERTGYADPDGLETIEAWECVEGCPVRELDGQSGEQKSGTAIQRNGGGQAIFGGIAEGENGVGARPDAGYGDSGGASRFFYTAKASRSERNAGLEGFAAQGVHRYGAGIGEGLDPKAPSIDRNVHPTVKPIALMRWLVRLVTPPGGKVLDPFTGSGTTGCAAVLEGFDFIGIEREPEYADIADARIAFWQLHGEDALRIVSEREKAAERRQELEDAGQASLFDDAA